MLFRTHILLALILFVIFLKENFFSTKFLFILLIAAIFPDLDIPKSKIGKTTGLLSKLINLFFQHRGFFHSFTFLIFLYLIFFLLRFPSEIFWLFSSGYLSHLFLDALTKEGIFVFWPLPIRIKGFIKTGSFTENLFFIIFFFVFVFLILRFFL